jgi:hypothetical protein
MSAPVAEGSGLIDIRAMAASTLGSPADGRGGSIDDLPAFGSFSPAAPVLLPLQSGGAPRWIYPVVALLILFVGGIGFMVWKVLNAKSPLEPERVVIQVPAPAPPPEAAKPAAAKGTDDGKPSTIPDDKLPPRAGDGEPKAEGKSEKSEHSHRSKGKKVASADDKKGATPAPAPDTGEKKPVKGSIDDLLLPTRNPRARRPGAATTTPRPRRRTPPPGRSRRARSSRA